MRLSARAEYAVRATVVLALHYPGSALPLREIARRESLSTQFLEQIFPNLRKAGLISSIRGAHGGYQLALPPASINIGDIVRAVEGPITPVNCLGEGSPVESACRRRGEGCLTRHVWEKLRDRMNEVLDGVSLADLME